MKGTIKLIRLGTDWVRPSAVDWVEQRDFKDARTTLLHLRDGSRVHVYEPIEDVLAKLYPTSSAPYFTAK